MHARPRSYLFPVLALGLVLTACGDGDEPMDAAGAEAAVRDFIDSFNDGDYRDACDRWTEEYEEASIAEWNEDGFGAGVKTCKQLLTQTDLIMRAFLDVEEGEDLLVIEEIEATVDGESATVTVDYGDGDTAGFGLVHVDGRWLIDSDTDEESGLDEESGTEPSASESPDVAPSAVGDAIELGDWTVTVTEVVANADDALATANEYNDEPRGQYVLVTYEAVYNGAERTADAASDLTWTFVTPSAEVLDEASQTTPAEAADWTTTVRTGGKARGQALFDVDPTQVEGGTISVETYDVDYDMHYADIEF
ncbi:hypothetical protein [Nocardioides sp. AE5]|uniref:hypothetical protein n=1 Tax=Nocardioides sp. AE5 TaxID=2962573 RepID=UPI0028819D96|nr:hypothetical protein [Nocardioides sp. AE5]MDT0202519.1 hypothetical protein [Nocardioides sp. AE5]